MFLASGEWDQAEGMLHEGLASLEAAGHRSRCVHPAAKLAELRLTQGRLEEAEQLLAGFEELPEAAHGIARLQLLRGESALAAATIHRRLNRIGDDNVLSAPFLAMLVDVQLAQGDRDGAAASAERLDAVARRSGCHGSRLRRRIAEGPHRAGERRSGATDLLEAAIARYGGAGMTVDVARARLELARVARGGAARGRGGGGANGARRVRACWARLARRTPQPSSSAVTASAGGPDRRTPVS